MSGQTDKMPTEAPPMEARLLAAIPDVVIVVDPVGTIRWGNPSAERLFERSVQDAVGLAGLDFVHPDDLELVLRSLESIRSKEAGTPIEIRLRTPNGWRLMELVGAPVDWDGEAAVLLTMRDLTERRRYEVSYNHDLRFRSLVQNAASITLLVSPAGVVESASGGLTRRLGHDPEVVAGQPLSALVDTADRPILEAALERAALGANASNPVTTTIGLLHHAGRATIPFELSFVDLTTDPTVGGFIVSAHDVSDRVAAELAQRKSLSLVEATLDATAEGILVVDNAGRFTSFNHQFTEMWQLPGSILMKRTLASAAGYVRNQVKDPDQFITRLNALSAGDGQSSSDVLEFLDGRVFEARSQPQRVDGQVVGRVWSFRDVTDRRRLELDLSYQAFHDPLTGLGNRALFIDRLEHAIARACRSRAHFAVLFLDVDGFKSVNDGQGHAAGDQILISVAHVLNGGLRGSDSAARLGGDEFGVLLEDLAHPSDAVDLAERILAEIRNPLSFVDARSAITASLGIAIYEDGVTGDQLLGRADAAMYAVKSRGGDGSAVFAPEMAGHGSDAGLSAWVG